jgi:four helix bundle protein
MKNNLFELKVWHKAIDVCEKVYKITENFPAEEKYGLTSQLRRSAVSTASNIAEGAGRFSNGEFRQFLGMTNGSSYGLRIIPHTLIRTSNNLHIE